MINLTKTAAILLLASATTVQAQTIIADTYTAVNVNNGFLLGEGLNSGITLTETRLTGTAVDGLRYMASFVGKPSTSYNIDSNNRMRVTAGAQSGRVTLSADGTSPFDFGTALGVAAATAANPITYDVTISMRNSASGTHRMSFALSTVEGATGVWDFGLQLHKAVDTDTTYTVSKRFDTASVGIADVSATMFGTTVATGTMTDFLIRVTDAGAETTGYNSNIKVSIDDGATWAYDTALDGALVNGFRFDGASRFFLWDIAGGNSAAVLYDNFSVVIVPEPSALALGFLAAIALIFRRRK